MLSSIQKKSAQSHLNINDWADVLLGYGIDGIVVDFTKTSVVKISEYSKSLEHTLKMIYLHQPKEYVKLLDFEIKDDMIFQYLEKLNKISSDEEKVFFSILSHEDANKTKNFSMKELMCILKGLQCGLDFNINEVIDFYFLVKNSKFVQKDLHTRNIMKSNSYKLIDFDRVYYNQNS